MKKLFVFIFLTVFLLGPVAYASTESSLSDTGLTNNISESTVNQYIFINCDSAECHMIIQQLLDRVQTGSPVYATEDESAVQEILPADTIEEVAPEPEAAVEPEIIPDDESAPIDSVEQAPTESATAFQSIRISEIVAVPMTGNPEWVELYNPGAEAVDLTDWSLVEGSNRSTKLFGVIEPRGYLVFDKSSLNNDGDIIILKDKTGQVIDQIVYGVWDNGNVLDNAPSAEMSESIILWGPDYVVTESPTPADANILFVTAPETVVPEETATPETIIPEETVAEPAAEIVPTVAPTSENACATLPKVRINEFLPDPADDEALEWIELYNDTDTELDLSGWTIDDLENGGSSPFVLPAETKIGANGYLVLEKAQTKLSLNNTTDSVVLKNKEMIVSKVDYTSTKEGKSWGYFDGAWELTGALTKGAENTRDSLSAASVSEPIDYILASATEARLLSSKTKVQVSGQVAALPGAFGDKVMYLNGLQIYMSSAEYPELSLGDQLQVLGKVSVANDEKRLLVASVEDFSGLSAGTIEPQSINSGELTAEMAGFLVDAQGELVLKKGGLLTLVDDVGEFGVLLKQGADIPANLYQPGETLKVAGIVSAKDERFVIMPRSVEDIQNKTAASMPFLGAAAVGAVLPKSKAKARALGLLVFLSGLLASVKTYLFLRKKRKNYLDEIAKMRQTLVAKYS